jgi:protease I
MLVDDHYQELEFWYPVLRLREACMPITVIAREPEKTYLSRLEYPVIPDIGISEALAESFRAVLVPGGEAAQRIASEPRMQRFIADAGAQGAVLGATTVGVLALAASGAIAGKRVAARDRLWADLSGTGAICVNEPVVTDGRVVTARSTDGLPQFFRALLLALAATEEGAPG